MPALVKAAAGVVPLFGVCLGHQMIGAHFGGAVVPAATLVHGKATRVFHDGRTIYRGLTDPFAAGRYHSLAIREESLPACLEISSRAEDGEIMGLRHRELPIESVQFHPESVLTPEGDKLIANVLGWFNTVR
jgi:anthranilate synthase/aminodeoxychorismate synthase-like glutamine amidotransferase